MSGPKQDFSIPIASITRTQGLRGQVRVAILFDDDRLFEEGRRVTLTMEGKSRDTRIEHFRHQHGRWVVKLESIDSISDAEEWIGASLSVRKSELPDADEGSYFSFDLEGCDVYTDLRRVGAVKRILDYGSTVLLEVDRDGREVLIPFAEAYLEKVDIERKRIDVRLPDGLLELNG